VRARRRQRQWAKSQGLAFDQNGYLDDYNRNFFLALSARIREALERAGGGELEPQRDRPARINALHSSAALAINTFQYFEDHPAGALLAALGVDGRLERLEFESQFATGLPGYSPTLDVALWLADGRVVAIESKFTEWMTKQRPRLADFREKYLKAGQDLWSAAGLPACQSLAGDMAAGTESFRHLGALQLLKHALGLARSAPGLFSLIYIYYDGDAASAIAARHRDEVARFSSRLDPSLDFKAMSYQALFAGLVQSGDADAEYLHYLRLRYFS
jgi:hypothetical protein